MKKLKLTSYLLLALGLSGCSTVTNYFSDEDAAVEQIETAANSDRTSATAADLTEERDDEVVFPELSAANLAGGVFPNRENLTKLSDDITKKDLYHLLGRPHFRALFWAKEWDYILKFHEPDLSVKTCQLKIRFDKDNIAKQFFWKPSDCLIPK